MTSSDFERIGEEAAAEAVEARSQELSDFEKACCVMRGALRTQPDLKVPELRKRAGVAAFMEQHRISLATLRQAATKVRNDLKAQLVAAPAADPLSVPKLSKAGAKSNRRPSPTQLTAVGTAAPAPSEELPLSTRPHDRRAHHSAEGM